MKFQSVVLFLATIFFFYSCEKEYSFENGGTPSGGGTSSGTAVYAFDGGTGACTGAIVSGSYTAGTALTSSETIEVTVNVTTPGTYTLTTNKANGIFFAASGTFTATGTQTITLTGSGTPTAEGLFNFSIGSKGCLVAITVTGASGGAAVFSLGGSPGSCAGFSVTGNYTAGTALIAGNTAVFNVNVSTIGSYSISTDAVNGISFSKSGSFTATGNQAVTLNGTGTPAAAGNFTYTVTSGTSTCSFIVTTVAAGPVAAGTLDCAGATQAGDYTQGNALTSSNTITIPVNITTAGSYSITTAVVNGVTFSGSGILSTGAQNILLTGNGTPTASGTNSFSITLGTSSCSFSVNFLPGTTPSTDYLRCNINGVAKTFNVNLAGTVPPLTTGSGFSIDGQATTDALSPALSIALVNLAGSSITTGTYNFLSLANPLAPFCFPVYDDGSNTWSQSTNNQPGTFTVVVTTKTSNRITGTFSGTLYEQDGAGPTAITFTNGEFSVPY